MTKLNLRQRAAPVMLQQLREVRAWLRRQVELAGTDEIEEGELLKDVDYTIRLATRRIAKEDKTNEGNR